jgi:hypothetical protein
LEKQSLKITSEEERKTFYESIEKQILEKDTTAKEEYLSAFKESVFEYSKRVDEAFNKSEIKVYPSFNEEVELLKSLFQK